MKPIRIEHVLPKDELKLGQAYDTVYRHERTGKFDPEFFRKYVHNHPFFVKIHRDRMLRMAREVWGDVIPSYCFLSMYLGKYSECKKHMDRPQCKYTIDLCLQQDNPWPLFVEGKKFILKENEALAYSGTDQEHWRDPQTEPNLVTMVFFHFVPGDFDGKLD